MDRGLFYSSIKTRLIKIGLVQIFLGLMEMVNVLIIYKIIDYSLEAIQSNQSYIIIKIGSYFDLNISLLNLLLSAFLYLPTLS